MGKPIWNRDQIAARVLAGETLVIYRGQVLRITPKWLAEHPGGALGILHFVGRDATDEIGAFHADPTLARVQGFAVAEAEVGEHGWEPLVPPVMSGWVRKVDRDGKQTWFREAMAVRSDEDTEFTPSSSILLVERDSALDDRPGSGPALSDLHPAPTSLSLQVQARHSAAYKQLHKRITDAGLYDCPYVTGYGPEVLRYALLAACSALAYSHSWYITSAIFLGLLWHQLVFTVHDLGHMGVTHSWTIDRLIAILIADFMGGLSVGWWVHVSILRSYLDRGVDGPIRRTTMFITVSSFDVVLEIP
jgi:sphingolipid 8-(E)-desaturase